MTDFEDKAFREWIILHLGILMESPTVSVVEATYRGWELKVYRRKYLGGYGLELKEEGSG